jgi:hypothetical protein
MNPRIYKIIIFLIIIAKSQSSAQWVQVADFGGIERDDLVSFTCNQRAFAGTGMQAGYQVSNDFYEYYANTDQWLAINNLPGVPRQYAFSFSFNELGFVFAGIDQAGNDLKDGYYYNSQNSAWTMAAEYPGNGAKGCASSTIGNLGFAGLGRSVGNLMHHDWWQYNLANDTWIQKANFPGAARNLCACFESNGFIFIVGGIDENETALDDIWKYNPTNDTWISLALTMSFPFGYTAFCKVKQSGVLVGGYDGQVLYTNQSLQLDAFNELWIDFPPIPANYGLKGAKAFSLNNVLYVTCGIGADNARSKSTWKYDLINSSKSEIFKPNVATIFPLPAKDQFYIDLPKKKDFDYLKYEILTMNSKLIKSEVIPKDIEKIMVAIDEFEAGSYLIKIYHTNEITYHKLIICN